MDELPPPSAPVGVTAPATLAGQPHAEIEWQFDVVDLRPVDRWLRSRVEPSQVAGEPAVGPPSAAQQTDLYADTDDWRLHRAGYVLRLRRKARRVEATLKSVAPADQGLRTRTEITEALRTADLDTVRHGQGPVGWRVGAMSGSHPLRPVLTVRTRRTTFPLHLDGRPVGEIALDATTIPVDSSGEPVRLRRVEVEVEEAAQDRLRPFVDDLRESCGLWPAGVSKFEAGLLAAGLDPAQETDLGPDDIDDTRTAGEVAFAVMRTHFAAFLRQEPGTRLGEDPEELHDMRVAARRLRAALGLFAEVLPVRASKFREELKWMAIALGDVRDLDVQLEQLDEWERTVDPEDRRGLEALRGILESRRRDARRALMHALDSSRHDRLVTGFSAMLRRGPLRRSAASRVPALVAGPDLIERRYRKVRRSGGRIDPSSPPEAYHRLRIQAKRLRYALEFMSPVYGKPARALIRRLVSLQDLLGQHQDAQVAMSRLRAMVGEIPGELPAEALFAMGMIAERYAVQAAGLRGAFGPAFRKLSKRWAKLERAMERRRAAVWRPPQPVARSQIAVTATAEP